MSSTDADNKANRTEANGSDNNDERDNSGFSYETIKDNILFALGASILPSYIHRPELDSSYGAHATGHILWNRSVSNDGNKTYSYDFLLLSENFRQDAYEDFKRFGIKFEEIIENGKHIVRINDPHSIEELEKEINATKRYKYTLQTRPPREHYTDEDIHAHIDRTVSFMGEASDEVKQQVRDGYFEIVKQLPPEQQALIIESGRETVFGSEEDINKYYQETSTNPIKGKIDGVFFKGYNKTFIKYESNLAETAHHEEAHRLSYNNAPKDSSWVSENPEWMEALEKEKVRHTQNPELESFLKTEVKAIPLVELTKGYPDLLEHPEETLAQFTAIRNKIYAKLGGDIEGTNAFMQHIYPDLNQIYQNKILPILQQEALKLNPQLDLNGKRFPPHIASLEIPWRDYNSYDELFESNAWEKNKVSAIFGENARVIDVTGTRHSYPKLDMNEFITTINDGDKTYLVVRDFNHVEEYRTAKTSFATKLAGKEIKTLPNFEFTDTNEDDAAYTKATYGNSPKGLSLEGMSEAEKQALLNTMINHWNSFMDKNNIDLTYPSISGNHLIIAETTPQALVDECQNFIRNIKPVHTTEPPSIKGKVAGAGIGVAISGLIAGVIGLFSSNDAEANIGKLEQAKDAAVGAMADAAPIAGSAKALAEGRIEEAAHRFNDWIGIGVLSVGDFSRYFSRLRSFITGEQATVDAGTIESATQGVADFMKYAAKKGLVFSAEMEVELKQKIASAFTEEGKPIDPKHQEVLEQIFANAKQLNMENAHTQASAHPNPNLECSDVRKTDCTPSTTISIKAPQKTARAGV